MWIRRDLAIMLRELSASRPAVLVTGARQTGKTALLQNTFPAASFVGLDLPQNAGLAERDLPELLLKYPPPVIIDEVQYAPAMFRQLKVLIDRDRSVMGRFLLTGSQKHQLMAGSAESLAGRVGILELETLSLAELASTPSAPTTDQAIATGGYPELWASANLTTTAFYSAYLATYLERDVRSLLNVSSLRDFERFVRACALRSGQILNKAELARDVGITPATANHWISVLQASNLITLLEPWFNNRTKSLIKRPKLYINDCGLLCFLSDIRSPVDLTSSPLRGAIWETFVCSEIRKQMLARDGYWSCYFYADHQHEVDFLFHRGGRFELLEAKATAQPSVSDATQINYAAARLGEKNVIRRAIICRTETSYPVGDSLVALSVKDILSPSRSGGRSAGLGNEARDM